MTKKLFFIAFIAVYFILGSGLVWAVEWDNVKDYDPTTKTITVSNSLLWMVELGEVAKVKLNSELHRTIIDNNDYVAEFTITNYEKDYTNFIKSIEFYDYYNYKLGVLDEKQGTFNYKFWNPDYTTTRTINVTEEKCGDNPDSKNLTRYCWEDVTSSYVETLKGKWVNYDEKNPLPLGEVTIQAFYTGELKPGERIEFIPTFFGVRVTDWADFGTAVPYEFSRDFNIPGVEDGFGQTFTIGTNGTNATHVFKGFSMLLTTFTGTQTTCRIILANVTPAGAPNMTAINLVKFTDCTEIVTNQQNNFSFASTVILTAGTRYFFGFNVTGATMGHQYYTTANAYQGGNDYFMTGTGGAWSEQANIDNWFIEYGDPIAYAILVVNLNLPPSGTDDYSSNFTFNANMSVSNLNLTNATLFVWLANTTLNLTKVNTTFVGNNISTWNVSLGEGNYYWNVFACGTNSSSTYCQRASANFSLNVSFNPQYSNLINSPASPETYVKSAKYTFNSTWTDPANINRVVLNFNGANITASNTSSLFNVTLSDLGVGNYTYYWWANDTLAHTNITVSTYYNITQATPVLTLAISGSSWTVNNGTNTNVTAAGCPPEMTCKLSRNEVMLAALTDNSTLSNGTYVYKVNVTSPTQNYTYSFTQQTLIVLLTNDPPNINISAPSGVIPYYVYNTNLSLNWTLDNPAATCNLKIPIISDNWCRQDLPNVTTSCGGLDTGKAGGVSADYQYNFTRPTLANNQSVIGPIWNGINFVNVSFANGCFKDLVQLRTRQDTFQSYIDCYDGSTWTELKIITDISIDVTLNMTWAMSQDNRVISCTAPLSFNPGNYTNLELKATANNGTNIYKYTSWDYLIKENSRTYNINTTSYAQEIFIINITYSQSSPTPIGGIAFLNYSGTMYSSTKVGASYNAVFTSKITTPKVTTSTNKLFNWVFTYFNNTGIINISSNANNQTVSPIAIDDCGTYKYEIFNLLAVDEVTQLNISSADINETIEIDLQLYPPSSSANFINFSSNYSSWNARVCIENNLTGTNSYRAYAQIKYKGIGYSQEYYYIQNLNLTKDNTPQRIKLYDLLDASSTEFLITYKGSNFLPVENALINLNRKYVGEGVYKTVEIIKTDQEGQATAHFDLSGVNYILTVYKEGVLLSQFDNIAVFCEDKVTGNCKINLYATSSSTTLEGYDNHEGTAHSLVYEETTRDYTTGFTILSGGVGVISLNVTQLDNSFNNVACSVQSSTTTSGTLTCNVPASFNNKTLVAQVFKDGVMIQQEVRHIGNKVKQEFAGNSIILVLALFLTLPFFFAHSTIMISLGLILALIMSSALFFTGGVSIGAVSSLTYGVIVLVIVIIKLIQRGAD